MCRTLIPRACSTLLRRVASKMLSWCVSTAWSSLAENRSVSFLFSKDADALRERTSSPFQPCTTHEGGTAPKHPLHFQDRKFILEPNWEDEVHHLPRHHRLSSCEPILTDHWPTELRDASSSKFISAAWTTNDHLHHRSPIHRKRMGDALHLPRHLYPRRTIWLNAARFSSVFHSGFTDQSLQSEIGLDLRLSAMRDYLHVG